MEPPVFPVTDAHPDPAVGADDLGIHPYPVVLYLEDADPAVNRCPFRRWVAEEREAAHAEGKDHIPPLETVQPPAAQEVCEGVQDDGVGMEPGVRPRSEEGRQREHSRSCRRCPPGSPDRLRREPASAGRGRAIARHRGVSR